ncbi:arsenate reductase/protein-tyrosine-phosphatase family protein [Microbacterium pygmaeum]|uniref:Protein-tyrosine-phosphatase n=1 Tax=Microbacterium pygmaeum TaxID=370764 RepID=A0A1G8DIT1_9MICO|nr:ArsR family transcriptional regulator [Microbacterium pygmaeum]SDH57598.1 Protein-tyrosine-phosphatase [Microbacterium pygmaeum]
MTDLDSCAAVFAALADRTRLGIVDLLTLGDLASSEISRDLRLGTNLVAHHLHVLESAGIIVRSPSEADKRRNYVSLRAEVFETLAPRAIPLPPRVLFVCTANSARSQLAEAIWQDTSTVPSASAGIRPADAVNAGALAAAQRHGLRIDDRRRPRHVDDARQDGDLVITVCDAAHEQLQGRDDLHWSIPDPAVVGTPLAFDAVFDMISHRIRALSGRLIPAA